MNQVFRLLWELLIVPSGNFNKFMLPHAKLMIFTFTSKDLIESTPLSYSQARLGTFRKVKTNKHKLNPLLKVFQRI